MPSFFIDRPIFAWVVALFICLIGAISIPLLAVAQYPIIAPPSISISTSYPGASPENLYNSVTRLIEEELNGASGILNFESTSDSLGQVEIIANFVPGTETGAASVEVQNRLKRVEARLPRAVIQQGILVEEASSAVLQIITLNSTDGSLDEIGLGDFMIRNVLGEIRRIRGVGRATLYSTERSLRIWIDPAKLVGYGLTPDDVNKAITAQNAQVASGSIGAEPRTVPLTLEDCDSSHRLVDLLQDGSTPLSDDGSAASYQRLRNALAPLGIPTYCVPGNHDVLSEMTANLHGGLIHVTGHVVQGSWQIVLLNSQVPGHGHGEKKFTWIVVASMVWFEGW